MNQDTKLFGIMVLLAISLMVLFSVVQCSTEEEDNTPPPSIVITPKPEPEPTPAPTQYTLTVTAGEGGTVSSSGGTYDEGTSVTITATPNEGYQFVGWEGNDSLEASLSLTLNSNQTLNALFERSFFVSTSERYSEINESTGYFNESYYFKRYITYQESQNFNRTQILDGSWTYQVNNQNSISYDFDGDGYLDLYFFSDIVLNNKRINGKHCFIKDFFNASPPYQIIETDASFSFSERMHINDIDNDGKMEILIWTWEEHDRDALGMEVQDEKGIIIAKFDSNFNLVYEKDIGTRKAYHYDSSGDIDNDGDIDLLAFPTKSPFNNITLRKYPTILYNDGNGNFIEELIFENTEFEDFYYSLPATTSALFDINNDGFLDIIFAEDIGTEKSPPPVIDGVNWMILSDLYILWGNGTGKFNWNNKTIIEVNNDLNFGKLNLGFGFTDYDLDGDIDVLVVSTRCEENGSFNDVPSTLYINYIFNLLENQGNKNFNDVTNLKIDGYYHINREHAGHINDVYFHDIDGDGDYDLVPRDFASNCCLSKDYNWSENLYWENKGGSFVRRIND